MRRLMAVTPIGAALDGGTVLAAATAQAPGAATVSVVHGMPNAPVNVFVNGKDTLKDVKPGTVACPLSLAPGCYDVKIFPASDTKGTGKPVIEAKATLNAGVNYSLVAHLTASGK